MGVAPLPPPTQHDDTAALHVTVSDDEAGHAQATVDQHLDDEALNVHLTDTDQA